MTRRERLEAKLEKRQEWAEGRERKAAAAFSGAREAVAGIPFGQPILVGHHSEKRHRRALERSDARMRAGIESSNMAEHHRSAAAGLERQLEGSIFSDDPDAIEALEAKARELEAERDRRKLVNKLYKKGDAAGLAELGLDLESIRAKLEGASSWCRVPFPSYSLTNLGARIRDARKRIEIVRERQARAAAAEEAGGLTIARHESANWCRVTFAEKPDRATLEALRAAGYGWGGGSWQGYLDRLPAAVLELERDQVHGYDPSPKRCVCGGSGSTPGNTPETWDDGEPCPYHAEPETAAPTA